MDLLNFIIDDLGRIIKTSLEELKYKDGNVNYATAYSKIILEEKSSVNKYIHYLYKNSGLEFHALLLVMQKTLDTFDRLYSQIFKYKR